MKPKSIATKQSIQSFCARLHTILQKAGLYETDASLEPASRSAKIWRTEKRTAFFSDKNKEVALLFHSMRSL
jgi:hypothetical protein